MNQLLRLLIHMVFIAALAVLCRYAPTRTERVSLREDGLGDRCTFILTRESQYGRDAPAKAYRYVVDTGAMQEGTSRIRSRGGLNGGGLLFVQSLTEEGCCACLFVVVSRGACLRGVPEQQDAARGRVGRRLAAAARVAGHPSLEAAATGQPCGQTRTRGTSIYTTFCMTLLCLPFLVFTPLLCACVLQYEVGAPVGVESDHGSVTITSHGSSSRVVGFVQVLACNYGTAASL